MRTVVIPAAILPVIRAHLDGCVGQGPDSLVFTGSRGGVLRRSNFRRAVKWSRTVDAIGASGLHFHDLRHSAASILLSMGANPKVIQELLGHSEMSITLGTYAHLFPTMQEEAMGKWDEVFGDGDDEKKDERG